MAKGETVVAPATAKEEKSELVEVQLMYPLYNNYSQAEADALGITLDSKGRQVYAPGKHLVDPATAEDLSRRQMALIRSQEAIYSSANHESGEIASIG